MLQHFRLSALRSNDCVTRSALTQPSAQDMHRWRSDPRTICLPHAHLDCTRAQEGSEAQSAVEELCLAFERLDLVQEGVQRQGDLTRRLLTTLRKSLG
jgi:hypothetical protein